jgi:hypothetical protein
MPIAVDPAAERSRSEESSEAERRVEAERGSGRPGCLNVVEQRGIEHEAPYARSVAKSREKGGPETTPDDSRRREVSASEDVVERALARAMEAELDERRRRVSLLAGELQARRHAREGVPRLASARRRV